MGAALLGTDPVKLASTTFNVVNASPELAAFWTDHFAQQLSSDEVKVITSAEIASLLGLEREKTLLGCSELATNCAAELANALGVDGLVRGSVGKFGEAYQVNVRVVAASDGRELAKYSATLSGDREVLEGLSTGAREIRAQLTHSLRPTVSAPWAPRSFSWIPAVIGAAGVAGGLGFLVSAQGRVTNLLADQSAAVGNDPLQYARDATRERTVGAVLTAAGSAAILGGVALFVFGGPPPLKPVVVVTPGVGVVAVAGTW